MSDAPKLHRQIADNWKRIREEVTEATLRAGRAAESVRIIGVSKYVDAEATAVLFAAGCTRLGESRPQQLWSKAEALADLPIQWHLVGHLQRNKIRRTLPLVHRIHSIDSRRLLEAVNEEALAAGTVVRGLVEVNLSGETAKHGVAAEEVEPLLERAASAPGLVVEGLMGMAGYGSNRTEAQRAFARLRQLRDRLHSAGLPPGIRLDELSMGMSRDFALAIAEGATLVRIGSSLFAPP